MGVDFYINKFHIIYYLHGKSSQKLKFKRWP